MAGTLYKSQNRDVQIMNAIEVENVTRHYKGFTLDKVSFNVPSGSIMGFVRTEQEKPPLSKLYLI